MKKMDMKNNWVVNVIFLNLSILLLLLSCDNIEDPEKELTSGKDYNISSQEEVNNFKVTDGIRTLTIKGEDISDLSNLQFKNVKNLIIENTGIVSLTMPQLSAVTLSFTIKGNNKLVDLNGLNNLKFINGPFTIEDNPSLVDISGLLGIKLFKGDLIIRNNPMLGENLPCSSTEIGFCVIKYLLANNIIEGKVTLANNHPLAVTDPTMIGQIPGNNIISYTLTSKNDVDNFLPLSDKVANLTIKGMDITDSELRSVANKISSVQDTITIENTNITTTEGFFDVVDCEGSIILRDNLNLTNPNGFKNYTSINGDLIIENCPNLEYWVGPVGTTGFCGITRIEGNFVINPATKMGDGGGGFAQLSYVGGDFILMGDRTAGEIWNLAGWLSGGGIKHIGGDLVFSNHYKVNGLAGFENLEYIGGDIYIMDNGGFGGPGQDGYIPLQSEGQYRVGFCLVKTWIDNGVVAKQNPVIQLRQAPDSAFIDINTLEPCE
jgi:hypothetical protein